MYVESIRCNRAATLLITKAVLKVMPPIYFHGNYNRYKEHNTTI